MNAPANAAVARVGAETWPAVADRFPKSSVGIENICKDFGATPVLRDVSLTVGEGELIALLGPSGSGKTTLLRILGGLEGPTAGRVLLDGEDARDWPVQARNVGFVFQQYALFRHMSVFDNVAFGLASRPAKIRPHKAEIRRRVMELLELVQLPGLDRRYPAQLSGGQRQRVALARALAIHPRLLLLDEPFGALDARVRKELRRWLRTLHDKIGCTTIFVTHDQEEALELADRVVVMSKGRIEQIGAPDDIYDRPGSAFVFNFIGDSSNVPVVVQNGGVLLDGRPLGFNAQGVPDGPAHLYFRPHDVEIPRDTAGTIPGVIEAVRRNGPTRRVEIAVGSGQHRIEVDVPPGAVPMDTASIRVRPRHWRVFPASA